MAADKEELIFEIDVKAVEQSLANLTKSTNDLKQANKDLAKEVAAGNKDAAAAVEKNNAAIKIQQDEYRALQRNLVGYVGAKKAEVDQVNFSNNSIKANRELLKQLTAQYITLKNPSQQATNDIKRLSDTLKQQEGVIGDTRRNVGNYAQGFKDAIGGIVGGIPGLKGFQTAQLGVNAAMNANPAGAVVLAFQAVVEIFKSNAAVADALTFAVDGLTKGFGFIIDTIVDTVTNFDNLTEAITHPIDFLTKLATGTVNAAKEGYNASKALDEFTVANARTAAAIAENDIQVQALTKSLKDKTKSEQERIKIANQIADIEIKNTELSKKLAQDELAAEQLKLKGRTLSGEQEAKLIELQSKVKQAAAEADIVRAQRQTRINILLEKELTAAKKEEAKTQAEIEKEKEASIQKSFDNERTIRAAEISLLKDSLQKRQLEFDLAFEKEEQALREAGASEELITQLRNAKMSQITADFYKGQTKQVEGFVENRKALLEQAERDLIASADRAAQELGFRQTAQLSNILSSFGSIFGEAANLVNQFAEQNVQKLQEQYDQGIINEEEFNVQSRDLKLKAFKDAKALKITEAIITTATSTINAFNSGLQLGGPFGFVIGTIFAAAAAGVGAAQVALIARQQPPKYAKGIIGLDGPGSETSDSIPAYLSKGESVITAKATKRFAPVLAQMEMAVGNTPNWDYSGGHFATGVIGQYGDGGSYVRSISQQAPLTVSDLTKAFSSAPAPVVSVREINNVNARVQKSTAVSEL